MKGPVCDIVSLRRPRLCQRCAEEDDGGGYELRFRLEGERAAARPPARRAGVALRPALPLPPAGRRRTPPACGAPAAAPPPPPWFRRESAPPANAPARP